MTDILLALDVGTTSLRAIAFSHEGEVMGHGHSRTTSFHPEPGRVEQDAETIWQEMQEVIKSALKSAKRKKKDITAIGVTTQRSSVVVWDAKTGRTLSPMVVWSDTRAVGGIDWLAKGYLVVPQMAAAKLPLVIEGILEGKRASAKDNLRWGNIDSYLIWKLTQGAAHITDRTQATTTGYLDPQTLEWNDALIAEQGLHRALFPKLVDSWGPLATTSRRAFGASVPITSILADQQSAMMAHGAITPGACKVSYGTSGTFNVNTGDQMTWVSPTLPPWVQYAKAGKVAYCIEGMVLSAGSVFDWLAGVDLIDSAQQSQNIAAQSADNGGVYMLPSLQGIGAPFGNPERKAMIGGLGGGTTKAHIARAAMEGISFRIREIVDFVYDKTDLDRPAQLPVDGGATTNDLFMQIQADLLHMPVARHAVREGAALGVAIAAGLGGDVFDLSTINRFAKYDRVFEPQISADEAATRLRDWQTLVSSGAEG